MFNNDHLQLKKQRKNAFEILKQWEMELNFKNELEKNSNLTKITATHEETNVNHIRLISNKEYKP